MAFLRSLIWLLSLGALASGRPAAAYDDATLTLTSVGTPDPFVTIFLGQYYLTYTTGNRIEMWSSNSLVDIETSAIRHQIWTPPADSEHSTELWAPELHAIGGRWYIYYTAADGRKGSHSHRMYVLGGPPAIEHPCSKQWEFLGRVRGLPEHQWAIDGTVFVIAGQLYMAYSGWPLHESELYRPWEDDPFLYYGGEYEKQVDVVEDGGLYSSSDEPGSYEPEQEQQHLEGEPAGERIHHDISGLRQQIHLVRLDTPSAADTKPVVISDPTEEWEVTRDGGGAHAINEGPEWLASPDGRWRGLVFSCAASWTNQYKMATLQYVGGPPLNPASWRKSDAPLLQTRRMSSSSASSSKGDVDDHGYGLSEEKSMRGREKEGGGIFGPGHGSFVDLGSGSVIAVYHATSGPNDGWSGRLARVQRVAFLKKDGAPYMGQPAGADTLPADTSLFSWIKNKLTSGTSRRSDEDEVEDSSDWLEGRSGNGKGEQMRAFLEDARATRAAAERADIDIDVDADVDEGDDRITYLT